MGLLEPAQLGAKRAHRDRCPRWRVGEEAPARLFEELTDRRLQRRDVRSLIQQVAQRRLARYAARGAIECAVQRTPCFGRVFARSPNFAKRTCKGTRGRIARRSEEHTSELQSP